MAHRYYSEIHLHLVWHTKNSLPLLTPSVEAATYDQLQRSINHHGNVILHAVGGTPTHVHICVTIPPTLLISDFIGKIKEATSYELNHQHGKRDPVLQWQSGYGVVSFGTGDLDWVKAYIPIKRSITPAARLTGRWRAAPRSKAKADESLLKQATRQKIGHAPPTPA